MKKMLIIIGLIIVIAVAVVVFVKLSQTKAVSSEIVLPDEARVFFGKWGAGRATLDIKNEQNGIKAEIQWASSAAEYSKWEYVCEYEKETKRLLCTGKRLDITVKEDGTEVVKTVYENGKAYFTIVDGKIIWDDKKEDAGRDMEFIK